MAHRVRPKVSKRIPTTDILTVFCLLSLHLKPKLNEKIAQCWVSVLQISFAQFLTLTAPKAFKNTNFLIKDTQILKIVSVNKHLPTK